jgi:hypothetical protein
MNGTDYFDINEYVIYDNYMNEKQQGDKKNFLEKYKENKIFEPFITKIEQVNERKKKRINEILSCILGGGSINYTGVRKYIHDGIPDDLPSLRPLLWKLLLNYLPSKVSDWEEYIIHKISDYEIIKEDLANEKDESVLDDITKDVKRTKTHMHFFFMPSKANPNEANSDVLTRILYNFAKLHPDIKYVQGMNELLAPIYYCFSNDPNMFFKNSIEAECFYCFENLMLEIKEIFLKEKDHTSTGIHARINKIDGMLELVEPDLYFHFHEQNLHTEYFAFRWLTLFFTQEFNMADILRIWDCILTYTDKFEYVSFLCVAVIVMNKDKLMNKDFSNIMFVMQNLNVLEIDIEKLLITAEKVRAILSN